MAGGLILLVDDSWKGGDGGFVWLPPARRNARDQMNDIRHSKTRRIFQLASYELLIK
jgi:hypothetical protein